MFYLGEKNGILQADIITKLATLDDKLILKPDFTLMETWDRAAEGIDEQGFKIGYDKTVERFINPLWASF